MDATQSTTVKTALEIGSLARQLDRRNQSYVLNTIDALLFSQQVNESEEETDGTKPTT